MNSKNAAPLSFVLVAALCVSFIAPLASTADESSAASSASLETTQTAEPSGSAGTIMPEDVAPVTDAASAKVEAETKSPGNVRAAKPQSTQVMGQGSAAVQASKMTNGILTIENHSTGMLADEITDTRALTPFGNDEVQSVVISGQALDSKDFSALARGTFSNYTIDISGTATTVIPDYALQSALSLKGISFPTSLSSIGTKAFDGCRSLVKIEGTQNVTSLSEGAFSHCSALGEAIFPKVTSMGLSPFWECFSLKIVSFPEATEVPQWMCWGNSSLETIDIPKATFLGKAAFQGCTSLKSASFPLAADTQQAVFYGCSSLEFVDLPNITTFRRETFGECTALRYLYFGELPTWKNDLYPFGVIQETFTNVPSSAVLFYKGDGDPAGIGWGDSGVGNTIERTALRYDVQPTPLLAPLGDSASFSLGITKPVPDDLAFGWLQNGQRVKGATAPVITIYPAHISSEGTYLGFAGFTYPSAAGQQDFRVDFLPTTLEVGPLWLDPPGPFSVGKGEKVKTVPSYAPVGVDPQTLWEYDHTMLSATFSYFSPADVGDRASSTVTFTAIKPGTTTVTYRAGGREVSAQIVITGQPDPNKPDDPGGSKEETITPLSPPIDTTTTPSSSNGGRGIVQTTPGSNSNPPKTGDEGTLWAVVALGVSAAAGFTVTRRSRCVPE